MDTWPHILVVDDDTALTASLCSYLKRFRLQAHAAADATALQRHLATLPADLVVLSTDLPPAAGAPQAPQHCVQAGVPFILVSTADTPPQQAAAHVAALEQGAADAMTRPFDPRELVARIRSVLRRTGPAGGTDEHRPAARGQAPELVFAGWRLRTGLGALTSPSGQAVALSSAEYRLLTAFLLAPQRVMSREQLSSLARGPEAQDPRRGVDLLVSRLRHKLQDGAAPGRPPLIKTVRGEGYLFSTRPAV